MGTRSYVPQLGRFLQPDPIPGGSANAYSYTFQDPINSSDPTGAYTATANAAIAAALAREAEAANAAREAAARAAAELAALEAQYAADLAGPQYTGGEEEYSEEWEEWYEEEGSYEYVSDHQHEESSGHEPRLEPAVLYQPLEAGAGQGDGDEGARSEVRGGGRPPCKECRKRRRYNVRIRTTNGSWTKVFDTYCGIVGGAFLTPGVDVFGAPAEVGCAAYGVYKALETIVEEL